MVVAIEVVPADADDGHGAGGGGQRRERLLVSQLDGVAEAIWNEAVKPMS